DAAGLPEVEIPFDSRTLNGRALGAKAPDGFGPFGGHHFAMDMGTVNQMQTTMMPEGPLPYDAAVYRIDEKGEKRLFIKGVQGGYPHVKFQGDRMLLGGLGKSYS